MLAAQMIAAHTASMECFRRAMLGEQTEGWRAEIKGNPMQSRYEGLAIRWKQMATTWK
jgi:hypothetical protein